MYKLHQPHTLTLSYHNVRRAFVHQQVDAMACHRTAQFRCTKDNFNPQSTDYYITYEQTRTCRLFFNDLYTRMSQCGIFCDSTTNRLPYMQGLIALGVSAAQASATSRRHAPCSLFLSGDDVNQDFVGLMLCCSGAGCTTVIVQAVRNVFETIDFENDFINIEANSNQ